MPVLSKDQAVERLCRLVSKVNEKEFKWEYASDCFCCNENAIIDEEVIVFIEEGINIILDRK